MGIFLFSYKNYVFFVIIYNSYLNGGFCNCHGIIFEIVNQYNGSYSKIFKRGLRYGLPQKTTKAQFLLVVMDPVGQGGGELFCFHAAVS